MMNDEDLFGPIPDLEYEKEGLRDSVEAHLNAALQNLRALYDLEGRSFFDEVANAPLGDEARKLLRAIGRKV